MAYFGNSHSGSILSGERAHSYTGKMVNKPFTLIRVLMAGLLVN